ncbi:hypothetical protein PMIN06_003858 [Paraphaeosphaeria minitans]
MDSPNPSPISPSPSQQLAKHARAEGGDGFSSYFGQLTGNPFFTAGFGLAALATAARVGQKSLVQGASLLRRRMLVDVEITHRDDAYPWLLLWMTNFHRSQLAGAQQASQGGILSSLVKRINPRLHHLQVSTAQPESNSPRSAHFSFVPGYGQHVLRYGSSFILVDRQRQKSYNMSTGVPFETVRMTTLYSHRRVFEHIFAEAHEMHQQLQEGKTTIHTSNGMDWKPFGEPKRKRPLQSIVLERGVKERIVEDVEAFIKARTWYLDRGVPYRRGYLLYGPPGTGKSSFIQALAGHLDYDIAILNVSERGLHDDKLSHMLSRVPPRTIVLLEDIDVAFANRRQADAEGYSGANVTFSGLLNALDGVASGEERIIFLTTNYVERLDEALIRPGRVDMTVRLGEATEHQMGELWDRFYAEFDGDGAGKKRFLAKANQLGLTKAVSTAALQGLFLYNKDDPEGAIKMMQGLTAGQPRRTERHVELPGHVDVNDVR